MATTQQTKKFPSRASSASKPSVSSKAKVSKSTTSAKKASTTKKTNTAVKQPVLQQTGDKVDFYPNRMTVAASALAGSVLVLFAVIAVVGMG